MEIGNKFIQICKDKGFDDKDIAKRYLSNQFNNIKTITGDVKEAVKIFQSITQNDKAAMFNTHGNLDENLVMEQFEKIRERYNRPTTVISIKDSKEVTANDDTEDIPYLEAEEVWPCKEPMWQVGSSTPDSSRVVNFHYIIIRVTLINEAESNLKSDYWGDR